MIKRLFGRCAALLCAAALAIGLALVATPAAQAWPWHPTVHVAGNITCDRIGTVPREIWLHGAGQVRSGGVNFWQNFGVTMYNVPRDPWITRADIKCSGNNGTYWFSRSFWAFRPGAGEQMNVNFRG